MPYTHEKTSNTIEDKNTIKSRSYFHCGPQHKTTGQDKTRPLNVSMHTLIVTPLVLCVVCCVLCVVCLCSPAPQDVCTVSITFHLSSLLDRVSAAGSFSRAGLGAEPRGQQLIGLRKALYRALRTAFRASRRATCHMLKSYPSRALWSEWVIADRHRVKGRTLDHQV